ncbi:MAG: DUF262 domain-containing protein [Candidatus Electrothrix sp. ATG2]|nr:DUF262 domain-containing protein [Candidatus Electrothrix sp. ATG2]
MITTEYSGKVHSFYSLIDKFRIEIPIIQRDYAQGREDVGEIRKNFLRALRETFSDKKLIMLDFIYGSSVEDAFQPLDGQQRLTTLFLLHLYAFKKANKPHEFLNKFSYETRISSREFCGPGWGSLVLACCDQRLPPFLLPSFSLLTTVFYPF